MSIATIAEAPRANIFDGEINQDLLTGLVAEALAKAQIAAVSLRDTVVPAWPPARRTFPEHVARRLERRKVFDETFVEDLNTFIETLAARIRSETYVGWEADENHVRGGYEVCYADDATHALIRCAKELRSVQEAITAVLFGLRAMRIANELLEY
ncbi:hypothetical protein [uncultured Marivita sp.]|uniref:hypothetical protein n=1 Tax=uncultured Marivita sp. TaxID=888080 RepID=UPI00262E3BE9|nr:hypothetical protein [uncultured Marivita sp.]